MASKKLSGSTEHRNKDSTKAAVGKSSNRSAEYVEDSDDDTSTTGEQSSAPENNKKRKAEASQKSKEKQSKTKTSTEAGKKPVDAANTPKLNGTRRDSSTNLSSSDNHTDGDKKTKTHQKHGGPSAPLRESSEKGSGDESSTDEAQEVEPADVVMKEASEPSKHSSRVAVARPKFTPPEGFKATIIPKDLWVGSLLTPEKLSGKEIWHIIAPPNVPISTLTTATILQQQSKQSSAQLAPHETVATYKGTEYSFAEDEGQDHRQRAYQPDAGSKSYSASGPKISRVLRLQRKPLAKPGSGVLGTAHNDTGATTSRAKPQQPEGLRMRYQPFGVSSDAHLSRINRPGRNVLSLSDVEDVQSASEKHTSSSRAHVNDDNDKKSKKRTKHKHSSPALEQIATSPMADNVLEAPEEEMQPEELETPEDRARRKAERKREKEERRARKAERRANRDAKLANAV